MKIAKHQMNRVLMNRIGPLALFAVSALSMVGSDVSPSGRRIFDKQLSTTEREVMAVVETMPAKKYKFAPTEGTFTHAGTFGVQARHIAFYSNEVAIA